VLGKESDDSAVNNKNARLSGDCVSGLVLFKVGITPTGQVCHEAVGVNYPFDRVGQLISS